jgi:hypothetical protein
LNISKDFLFSFTKKFPLEKGTLKILISFTNNIISVKGAKALLFNTTCETSKTPQATKDKASHCTFCLQHV